MYSDDMNFTETFISGHASQNNITTADIDSKTSTDGSTDTLDDLDTDTSDNTETQFYTPISGSVESESGRELEKRYNTKYQTTQGLQKSRSMSNIEEITELSIEKTLKEFSSSGSTFNFNFYQTSVSTSRDVTVGTSNRLTTEGQLIENKREENEDTLYDNQRKVQNNITSDASECSLSDVLMFWAVSKDIPSLSLSQNVIHKLRSDSENPVAHTCDISPEFHRDTDVPIKMARLMTIAVGWGGEYHLA